MKRIPMKDLADFGTKYLIKIGVAPDDAEYIAQTIVEAEAFRLSTHGLVQFTGIDLSVGKTLDPKRRPEVIVDKGPISLIDGKDCIGNLCIKMAKEMSSVKAKEYGISITAVRNTNWIGGLGIHLESLARDGFLARICAQTSGCKDCAPFGGIDPRFSTNPIAIAIPADPDPIIGDFSTATMSLGSAMGLVGKGAKAEEKRFLDKEGNPTDDPRVMQDDGTLMFMGCDVDGHKGYALSLWIEALVAMAGGSANNPEKPSLQSFTLIVLDPDAFGGRDHFQREMKRFVAHVRSSRARKGVEKIRLPGDEGFKRLNSCREMGLPMDESRTDIIRGLSEKYGIESPV